MSSVTADRDQEIGVCVERNGRSYPQPEQRAWYWDDRGRSQIPARKIAEEVEAGRELYMIYMDRADTRPLPHPRFNTVPPDYLKD